MDHLQSDDSFLGRQVDFFDETTNFLEQPEQSENAMRMQRKYNLE